jgi:hypothetical protein
LWITFSREFSVVFWGDFGEATGPGAGIRGGDGWGENVKMGKRGLALFSIFLREMIGFFGILIGAFHRRDARLGGLAAGRGRRAEDAEGNLGEGE